jgi:dipeptidase E
MKLLLTSAGVKNGSIRNALVEMLGKPIADCDALCIPTAGYGHPHGSPAGAWRFVSGREPRCPMVDLGWRSVGLLELTALPHLDPARWAPWVRNADILLANGGDAVFLAHWMRQSGLADLLPSLAGKVWLGLSAGSMALTPRVGEAFVEMKPSITGDDKGLGIVDFSIFPHLDFPDFPENSMEHAEQWAAQLGNPSYAIDDQTAIQVVDGTVKVISEGNWRYFGGQV